MEIGQSRLMRVLPMALLLWCAACTDSNTISNEVSPESEVTTPSPAQTLVVATVSYQGDQAGLPPGAKVFVFIREVGQRMPLAVQTLTANELPTQIGFSNPKMPTRAVEVVARLSMTGAVNKHQGDPEVVSEALEVGAAGQMISLSLPDASNVWLDSGQGPTVDVNVSLSENLEVPEQAKVYVIARAVDHSNPMPLAVVTLDPADLPKSAQLSDANSMMSMHRLSLYQEVDVVARLSIAGAAKRQPGDWESELVRAETRAGNPIELQISNPVVADQ